MIIFPAIDIRGGKCVRLLKGDFEKETVFSDKPEEMAKKWQVTVLDGITSAIIRIEYMVFQRAKIEGIWID